MNTDASDIGMPGRIVRVILLAIGLAELGAVAGVLMPESLMAAIHSRLGLGELPDGQLVPYLARSLAGLYMVHGGVVVLCAMDVRRYTPMIRYIAWSGILFAGLVTWLDIQAGFPWFWWAVEGPGLIVMSIAMLALLRRIPAGQEA